MIGDLRHGVVLQEPSSVKGAGGHISKSWTTLASVSAAIEPLTGAEELAAMQLEHPVSHEITVRHQPDLVRARRILFGARVFHVRSAINDGERNRYIIFKTEEDT